MMEAFGLLGFLLGIYALSKVKRLERTLRENNIRPGGMDSLGNQLRQKVGQTVMVTLYQDEGSPCKVLDADEEWAHVLRNEGKWNQRELLIRLSDVKQIKG